MRRIYADDGFQFKAAAILLNKPEKHPKVNVPKYFVCEFKKFIF
jgi:hypothetical protein